MQIDLTTLPWGQILGYGGTFLALYWRVARISGKVLIELAAQGKRLAEVEKTLNNGLKKEVSEIHGYLKGREAGLRERD